MLSIFLNYFFNCNHIAAVYFPTSCETNKHTYIQTYIHKYVEMCAEIRNATVLGRSRAIRSEDSVGWVV